MHRIIALVLGIFWSLAAVAGQFQEGKHYLQIPQANLSHEQVEELKEQYKDKVLVIEFFSYGCHWCHQLDSKVSAWEKQLDAKNIVFLRFPVVFQNSWVNLSKAYFTSLALGVEDTMHPTLFDAVQEEKIGSTSSDELQSLFVAQGIDGAEFAKTFDSFSIEQQFKLANQVAIALRITAIPSFVVYGPNGAIVTSTRMAGSEDEVFQVLDSIIEKDKKELLARKDSE